jgi:8-oxo-dGTP pyrophosphatase MutT (NUDIX family)
MKKPAPQKAARRASEPGRQFAALPYRRTAGQLEILLITSRETRRWVIPKGWPMKGRKPHEAAAREAYEEAGLVGRIAKQSVGAFRYPKLLKNGTTLICKVDVFPMEVTRQRNRWPERKERTLQWFSPQEAAAAVQEDKLRTLILKFSKRTAKKKNLIAGTIDETTEEVVVDDGPGAVSETDFEPGEA